MGAKRTDERLYGVGTDSVQSDEHSPYTSYPSPPGPPTTVTTSAGSNTDERLYGGIVIREPGLASALYQSMGLARIAGIPLADTAKEAIKVLGRGHRQRGHCSTLSISLPAGEESLVLAETVILSVSAIVYEKLCAALRLAKALSQEDLAFRAGIHRTYLGGIEPDLDFEAKGTA
jgi:hypothetical protein